MEFLVTECVEGGRMMNVWKSNADSMMLLTIYELFNSDGPPILILMCHQRGLALRFKPTLENSLKGKPLLACRLSLSHLMAM